MPLYLKNPRIQFIILLSILYLITLFHLPLLTALMLLILCVGGSVGFDFLFAKLKKQELRFPYSGVITGLILTLIIDTGATWYQILAIVFAAIAIKDFLRISDRHIFNPAASGLIVGYFVFGLNPSWWGASPYGFGKLHPADLAIAISVMSLGYVSCIRYKRYLNVLAFLIVSIVLQMLLLSATFSNAIAAMINPGSLFYALVMLPEPITTPARKDRQIMFGVFAAVVNMGLIWAMGNGVFGEVSNFPDTSLIALLLGNLLFFKFR